MTVRLAADADVEALVALINRAFEVERRFLDAERTDPADVRAHLAGGEFLILEEDGAPVGCVYLEREGARAYFGMLAVEPGRQKAGVGGRLVDAAEARARAFGCAIMEIRIVSLRDELFPYYRTRGYAETGETVPFPAARAHFVVMRKAL